MCMMMIQETPSYIKQPYLNQMTINNEYIIEISMIIYYDDSNKLQP